MATARSAAGRIQPRSWSRHIAAYLKRSVDTVRDDIITLPTFPRPIRLPMRGAVRAQALYKARDVIAWAERHVAK